MICRQRIELFRKSACPCRSASRRQLSSIQLRQFLCVWEWELKNLRFRNRLCFQMASGLPIPSDRFSQPMGRIVANRPIFVKISWCYLTIVCRKGPLPDLKYGEPFGHSGSGGSGFFGLATRLPVHKPLASDALDGRPGASRVIKAKRGPIIIAKVKFAQIPL